MKQLLYVRHAKSDWSEPTLSDFDRPLNQRGHHDAPRMAKYLVDQNVQPTFLLSSSANRALSTAQAFAKVMGIAEVKTERSLYEAFTAHLLHAAQTMIPETHDFAAIFSHNPAITSIVSQFAGRSVGNVPTCGVAWITFDVEYWQDIDTQKGKLAQLWLPKQTLDAYK